ncbi:hypothetical protein ACFSQ7_27605 [Paenibacillus rhizoplanae]
MIKPVYEEQQLAGYLRFSYRMPGPDYSIPLVLNLFLLAALGAVMVLLFYIRKQILRPFHILQELPYELSRGQVNIGMKEHRSRFFGRFIWGLDLLRQTLDAQKQTNLRLEKKTARPSSPPCRMSSKHPSPRSGSMPAPWRAVCMTAKSSGTQPPG